MKDERVYLDELLARIRMIEDFTAPGQADFLASEKTQEAVIRCFEVIGEIVKRLPADWLSAYPEIPWKQLAGFRDFLIHNYDRVNVVIVWRAVKDDIPALKAAIQAMLDNLDRTPEE